MGREHSSIWKSGGKSSRKDRPKSTSESSSRSRSPIHHDKKAKHRRHSKSTDSSHSPVQEKKKHRRDRSKSTDSSVSPVHEKKSKKQDKKIVEVKSVVLDLRQFQVNLIQKVLLLLPVVNL